MGNLGEEMGILGGKWEIWGQTGIWGGETGISGGKNGNFFEGNVKFRWEKKKGEFLRRK